MGTRHLTAVVIDGDFKVAQYGQWDGYPAGAGSTILDFLNGIDDYTDFVGRVRALRFANAADDAAVHAAWASVGADDSGWVNMQQVEDHKTQYPQYQVLSRDTGANVLHEIAAGNVEFLDDQRGFALDSLFCEWAYVIDLDSRTLEVYRGFQKEPHNDGRWGSQIDPDQAHRDDKYYPVRLVKIYSLEGLPDVETLIADVDPEEEEESA